MTRSASPRETTPGSLNQMHINHTAGFLRASIEQSIFSSTAKLSTWTFHPKWPKVSRALGAIGLSVYKYVD
jgi:hypothetical protein